MLFDMDLSSLDEPFQKQNFKVVSLGQTMVSLKHSFLGNATVTYSASQHNMTTFFLTLLFIILVALGLWLLRQSKLAQKASGLPAGEIAYSDMESWQRVQEPLLSRRHGLVGKPDYILMLPTKRHPVAIPVEVKSGKRPSTPHRGHVLQLGVYCLLVEEQYGERPAHGLLHYADATLQIPFTRALEAEVLAVAAAIRQAQQATNVRRSHTDVARCLACGYRDACGRPAPGNRPS